MNISRDSLLQTDFNTLFTHDPATFFEAILINILWDKEPRSVDMQLVERQRQVFLKWLGYYTENLKRDYRQEIVAALNGDTEEAIKITAIAGEQIGFNRGQIHALTNLPLKKTAFSKTVDLVAVAELLRQLKAREPRGVIDDEGQESK